MYSFFNNWELVCPRVAELIEVVFAQFTVFHKLLEDNCDDQIQQAKIRDEEEKTVKLDCM